MHSAAAAGPSALVVPSMPLARFVVSAPQCDGTSERDSGCTYRVAWAINPHMRIDGADPLRAVGQHCAFVQLLQKLGATVDRVPFVHGAFDSVFVKDNALLLRAGGRDHALLARLLHRERRAEPWERSSALMRRGFQMHGAPDKTFEGGDIVMLPGQKGAFLGTGFRSSREVAPEIERFLGQPVQVLELSDPHLFHLDMAMACLTDGTLIVCEEALSPGSLRRIADVIPAASIVRVPATEARNFALNVVQVGRAIVGGAASPVRDAALLERGYRVHVSPLDEFHRAGGSAACLVARVHGYEDVALKTTAAIRSTAA